MNEKLLRVEAPHYVAGAIWRRTENAWECVRAAPIIKWMVGKTPQQVASYLRTKGYKWEWL